MPQVYPVRNGIIVIKHSNDISNTLLMQSYVRLLHMYVCIYIHTCIHKTVCLLVKIFLQYVNLNSLTLLSFY